MKKITRQSAISFLNRKSFKKSNMVCDGNSLYLYNNKIAEHRNDGIYISNAGWDTKTTKERLNALGASIYQKNFTWYWKDGEEFPINKFVKLI